MRVCVHVLPLAVERRKHISAESVAGGIIFSPVETYIHSFLGPPVLSIAILGNPFTLTSLNILTVLTPLISTTLLFDTVQLTPPLVDFAKPRWSSVEFCPLLML